MAKRASWAMSLALIMSALAQQGCKICSCAEGSGVQLPGAAVAAASPAQAGQGGGRPGQERDLQLEERRHPWRRIRQRHRLQFG